MNGWQLCLFGCSSTGLGEHQLRGYFPAFSHYCGHLLVFLPARRKGSNQGISGFFVHQCCYECIFGRRRRQIVDKIGQCRSQDLQPLTMQPLGSANNHTQVIIACDQWSCIESQGFFDELEPLRPVHRRFYLQSKPMKVPTVNPDKVLVQQELIACDENGITGLKEPPQAVQGGGQGLCG